MEAIVERSYGTIRVLGYTKNNNLIGFKCKLYRPVNTSIAWGIYNCRANKTYIRVNRNGLKTNKLDIPRAVVIKMIEKILSQQDWDENITYTSYRVSTKYNTIRLNSFLTMWKDIKKD